MQERQSKALPLPVKRALRKLGKDISDARKRRRISTQTMAERAMISRPTLAKVERGDPGVGMGTYATIVFVLGMIGRVADLVDPSQDRLGLDLESENLPKRIARRKRSAARGPDEQDG
jgi:transcriptional regulator with XRE-family HTH domain